MTVLEELKPTSKLRVMDLLEEAGVDVSNWKDFKGTSAAANPRYCYNWSFEQPGEFVVVCLWYRDLKMLGGSVVYARNPKGRAAGATANRSPVWRRRNTEFGENLELAYRQQLPIRVIVLEGKQNLADLKPKASIVAARLLDPVAWAIKEYDLTTGKCLLARGAIPSTVADASSDLELSWFEGECKRAFVSHRRREAQARRQKLQEAMGLNGGRLVCEVPNCGFDFAKRYGSLGEGYAQVHHLSPLSNSPKGGREIKLIDLAVVCANCHVMIHTGGECRPLVGLISAASA